MSALARIAEYAATQSPANRVPVLVGHDIWHEGLRELLTSFVVQRLQGGTVQTSPDDRAYAFVGRWITSAS